MWCTRFPGSPRTGGSPVGTVQRFQLDISKRYLPVDRRFWEQELPKSQMLRSRLPKHVLKKTPKPLRCRPRNHCPHGGKHRQHNSPMSVGGKHRPQNHWNPKECLPKHQCQQQARHQRGLDHPLLRARFESRGMISRRSGTKITQMSLLAVPASKGQHGRMATRWMMK